MLDKEVVTILTQTSVARREAEIKLDETDFYEKKKNYKQKKLILEGYIEGVDCGQPPDEVDIDAEKRKERRKRKKEKERERKNRVFCQMCNTYV